MPETGAAGPAASAQENKRGGGAMDGEAAAPPATGVLGE